MMWFRRCWGGASALGQREGVEAAAPTQLVEERSLAEDKHVTLEDGTIVTVENSEWSNVLVGLTYEVQEKDSSGGRALDGAVDVAGSRTFFGAVMVALVGWAIAGAVTGAPDIWQIIIQDVSSIQCYISDMILMRQQQNAFREQLRSIALLRSRCASVASCFDALLKQGRLKPLISQDYSSSSKELGLKSKVALELDEPENKVQGSGSGKGASILPAMSELSGFQEISELEDSDVDLFKDLDDAALELTMMGDATKLQPKDFIDRVVILIANVMGNIWMLIAYCLGIIAWILLGPKYNWSNNWQLWLNTCTALQQTLCCCLLTLARNRHNDYVEGCMNTILRQECELEYRVRKLSGHTQPNPPVHIVWGYPGRFARALDWYAALLGSGYGAATSGALFLVWIGVGDPMGWSENWWLIIGTFTGVVGTLNAAVLRFTLQQEEYSLSEEYGRFIAEDLAIFNKLGIRGAHHDHFYKRTMMTRISMATSRVCATPLAVTLTLLLIVGLLIGATVVLWSETSQLLINSITMILESFFLIVLIDAHNIEATGHRVRLHDTLVRRLQLVVVAKRLSRSESERKGMKLDDNAADAKAPN